MSHASKIVIGTLAIVVLSGCGGGGNMRPAPSSPTAAAAAEAACLQRARASSVRNPVVIRSEFSQANTLVTVGGSQGDRYRCLSSNNGIIAEFSLL